MTNIKPPSAVKAMAKLPSPCTSVCEMDFKDEFCIGCYRTRGEIASWLSMDRSDQLNLLNILNERRAAATGAQRRRPRRQIQRLVL